MGRRSGHVLVFAGGGAGGVRDGLRSVLFVHEPAGALMYRDGQLL